MPGDVPRPQTGRYTIPQPLPLPAADWAHRDSTAELSLVQAGVGKVAVLREAGQELTKSRKNEAGGEG